MLTHLQNAPAERISVTVEVLGDSSGYDETTVRTVNENARAPAVRAASTMVTRPAHCPGLISVGKP